jgi:hypothetical protein
MATKLLENSSFALVRTNPKLTTNVKLVVDSTDRLYLESFDANAELSKAKYKAFKVSEKSSYDFDLSRFYRSGETPAEISFDVLRISSDLSVKESYGEQYEFQYNYGATSINSNVYSEEFGIHAPIWLESTIPDYFIVFRIDGPVNVNNVNSSEENLNELIAKDPANFVDLILKKSTIIKTFDLTENSNAGKYIRNYRNDERFPVVPLIFSTEREKSTKWNGVDIKSGGFTSKDEFLYKQIFGIDSTIIEDEFYITQGFQRNNIAIANIINMEFLFDDLISEDFTVNRYFGLYVNAVEEGKFQVSGDRAYRDLIEGQLPRINSSLTLDKTNTRDINITNNNGVKLYIEDSTLSVNYFTGDIDNDLVPDIFPKDFLPKPADVNSLVSIFYVKDKRGDFYNLKTGSAWKEFEEIRLSSKEINFSEFTGTQGPILITSGIKCAVEKGKASTVIEVISEIPHGDQYIAGIPKKQEYEFFIENIIPGNIFTISDGTNSINVTAINDNKDQLFDNIKLAWISSGYPLFNKFNVTASNGRLIVFERDESGLDVNFTVSVTGTSTFTINKNISASLEPIKITADLTLVSVPGEADGRFFNPTGTPEEIAIAMSKAFNNIKNRLFDATPVGNKVILVSKNTGIRFNKAIIGRSLFFEGLHLNLLSSTTGFSHPDFRILNFEGGTESCENRAAIDINLFNTFNLPERYLQVKQKNSEASSLKIIKKVSYYIDEPIKNKKGEIIGYNNFDTLCTVTIEEGENIYRDVYGKIYLHELYKIPFGRFSIFPIRDMDFDFYSTEYGDEKELQLESDYYSEFGTSGSTLTHSDIEDFYANKEFATLQGVLATEDSDNEIGSIKIESEYDRLQENYIKTLTVPSRVVPTINKWVYRNGKNVRESDYRLCISEAFGSTNFAPSSEEFEREVDYFTHEWYYLQKLPPYFGTYNIEDLNKVFSYFPEPIDVTSSGLLNLSEDYFTEYFTVDYLKYPILGTGLVITDEQKVPVSKQLRYSIFEGGNSSKFATAFHRGVKIIVKERVENLTTVDYNLQNIKTKLSNRFNNYKFSCVLIPHSGTYGGVKRRRFEVEFIENRKFNSITLLIYADITDPITQINRDISSVIVPEDAGFIDRTILYSLNSKFDSIDVVDLIGGNMPYADVELSGAIDLTPPSTTWGFSAGGTTDGTGELSRFLEEVTINSDGSYNRIFVDYGTTSRDFRVTDVLSDELLLADDFQGGGQPLGLTQLQINNGLYIYENGGYNHWKLSLDRLSFANIARLINDGAPEITYKTILEDGTVQLNMYLIELQTASRIVRPNYFKPVIDANKPVNFSLEQSIGYELKYQDKARIQPIYRHSGYYQPKFVDVIKFEDPYIIEDFINPLERNSQIRKLIRDANTQIKLNNDFSKIKNLFYHKVNDVNPAGVLELSTNDAFKPLYPLVGEIGIDKKDFYLWSSNWDPGYFIKNVNKKILENKIGTRSITENPSFFSSKIMKISDQLQVEAFDAIEVLIKDELDSIRGEIIKADNINELAYYKTDSQIIMDVYLEKRLTEVLANSGIRSFFEQYIKPEFGFGIQSTLEDDINGYIRSNILPRYTIDLVELFVLKSKDETFIKNYPSVISSLTDNQKISLGMVRVREFSSSKISGRSNFDTRVIYNTTKGYYYAVAPSFKIIKK